MSENRWVKVNRVEPNSTCESCNREVTVEQQRRGHARQSDEGSVRHGRCKPKEDGKRPQ